MSWQVTDDVRVFADRAHGLPQADPVRQTLRLTFVD
jgi:hypothetical protein